MSIGMPNFLNNGEVECQATPHSNSYIWRSGGGVGRIGRKNSAGSGNSKEVIVLCLKLLIYA